MSIGNKLSIDQIDLNDKRVLIRFLLILIKEKSFIVYYMIIFIQSRL